MWQCKKQVPPMRDPKQNGQIEKDKREVHKSIDNFGREVRRFKRVMDGNHITLFILRVAGAKHE